MKKLIKADNNSRSIPAFDDIEHDSSGYIYTRGGGIQFQLVGKFVGFDGEQYIALEKLGYGDKTYILYDKFVKQYQILE